MRSVVTTFYSWFYASLIMGMIRVLEISLMVISNKALFRIILEP